MFLLSLLFPWVEMSVDLWKGTEIGYDVMFLLWVL